MIKKFYRRNILNNKNNKTFYYLQAIWNELIPSFIVRNKLDLAYLDDKYSHNLTIRDRVDYYNKLNSTKELLSSSLAIKNYKIPKKLRVYYFDSKYYLKHFNSNFKFNLLPGDVIHVPDTPTIVKSRPIDDNNENSILLNLDKARHFNFVMDDVLFKDKKSKLIGRSGFSQPHRARFYAMYADHELCDLKKVSRKSDVGYLNIAGHLEYKFILALEGNDVATNLKWIMSSNSIAVMPKPKFETWFMEGRLIPDYHYICINDDYSDLEVKLKYYNDNLELAEQIIKNAHQYVDQFKNKIIENTISLLVLKKYFEKTNQM